MKFFTRRKSKILNIGKVWSTLIIMSAFAMFTQGIRAEEKLKDTSSLEKNDSIFTARKVFEKLHNSDLEILPFSTRLDMLDYWDVDSIYKASNAMEGLSWIEKLNKDYIKVRLTEVSTLEIKILPVKKGEIAMLIHTIGDDVQAQDSHVSFYDMELKELQADKYLEIPRVKDFFEIPKGSATKMKEIEEMIPFPTIAFSANAENDILEARLTVEKYMNEDDWNIARLFIKPYITLNWKKEKYKING